MLPSPPSRGYKLPFLFLYSCLVQQIHLWGHICISYQEMMCSSERWFVLYNGPPQPSLSDTIMSSRVVREAHGFHNVQGPEGSAWAGGTSPTIPVSGSSQPCSQGFHFWGLTTVFQSFITVWYDTVGAYERKCTVLIFVVMEEIEQESQRGLHLDYFNLFNVWLHHLKNKINKTPGEKTFCFECEKQEEMPTPPSSRGDFPEANVLADTSRRGGRGTRRGFLSPLSQN